MPGIDQHILFNGNYDLPEHKAPPGLWDQIEIMMLDVPASILPSHKPPLKSWDVIEAGLDAKAHVRKPAFIVMSALLIILFLSITSDNFYKEKADSTQDQIENSIPQNDFSEQAHQIEGGINTNVLNNKKLVGNMIIQDSVQEGEAIFVSAAQIHSKDSDHQLSNNMIEKLPQRYPELLFVKPKTKDRIFAYKDQPDHQLSIFDVRNTTGSKHINDQFRDCNYRKTEHKFGLNPGLEYQYMLNSGIPENTKNKYWYTFDLRIFYQANRFSIETGLGIGFSKDNINFSYNYLTNEIIDTYVYVDSAYFDPITGTTHYYTTTVNVYDSLPHSSSSFVEKKYTYLSIPVELGYEIIRKRNFCFGIKAGLTYYKEISLKETEPLIYHENSRITSLGTASCERRKEFVSLLAGIEFRWRMSDGLQFTAEPSYRYFLNQIYLADDKTKGSMSLGLRIGLRYNF